MKINERIDLLMLAAKDLEEAVRAYVTAQEIAPNRVICWLWCPSALLKRSHSTAYCEDATRPECSEGGAAEMTRTPDEIKKRLNDPIPVHFHIGDPEPRLTPLLMVDLEDLHADALAHIQRLETQNAELSGKIGKLEAENKNLRNKIRRMQEDRDNNCGHAGPGIRSNY